MSKALVELEIERYIRAIEHNAGAPMSPKEKDLVGSAYRHAYQQGFGKAATLFRSDSEDWT